MMKACIFDLDGTLADTLESIVYSVQETLIEMKLSKITKDQCREFVGNGARYLMEQSIRAAGDTDGERIDEAMKVYRRIFAKNCTYHVTLYEGIKEMADALKDRGVKLGVLSNKPHAQAYQVVMEMFGEGTFDCICGQQEHIKRKPDPEGLFRMLKEMNVSPEECLYVGDSEVDVETGRNGGIKTIGVTWGFRTKEELELAGVEHMIHHPMKLLQFV